MHTQTYTNTYITQCDRAAVTTCTPVQSLPFLSCSPPGSRCLGTAYSLSEFLCTKQTAALSTSGCKGKFALEMGRGECWINARYHEDGRRGENGVHAEVKLCQGCFAFENSLFLETSSALCRSSIMHSTSVSLWHHAASVQSTKMVQLHFWLCGVSLSICIQRCLLIWVALLKSCRQA